MKQYCNVESCHEVYLLGSGFPKDPQEKWLCWVQASKRSPRKVAVLGTGLPKDPQEKVAVLGSGFPNYTQEKK